VSTIDARDERGVSSGEPAAEAAPERKALLRDYTETILICVIFVIFSRAFVFQQSKIPSGSMMDTLLVGDYIMVNRFVYAPTHWAWERALLPVAPIRHGDVAVFKWPPEPEIDYIKRVIGLPGDTVELRDGQLYINGEAINEPYVRNAYRRLDPYRNYGPITVPPNNYFMLGDHRNASSDSRAWHDRGWTTVPRALIKGRALLIWWSYEEASSEPYMPMSQRLRSWGDKIMHFVSRSRWNRCFKIIR